MAKYVCTQACFFSGNYYKKGELFVGAKANKHFEKVNEQKAAPKKGTSAKEKLPVNRSKRGTGLEANIEKTEIPKTGMNAGK